MPTTNKTTGAAGPVADLAADLIRRPSITPEDAGCQQLIAARLAPLGFHCEPMRFGEVDNLWAVRGEAGPTFVFAGHTDVVPTGDEADWQHPPFEPVIADTILHGRGAADMKGSLAAMVVAIERLLAACPALPGRIALLLTSDEEGLAINGTRAVMAKLMARQERMDWCLIGEPSSGQVLGDTVRIGRRGSLNGELVVRGVQGHIAYPQYARNPVHEALDALSELASHSWDTGNAHFPRTRLQISNITAGTGATNIIPGRLRVLFNLRYNTEQTAERLAETVNAILDAHRLDYELNWTHSGQPFLTPTGALVDAVREVIRKVSNTEPVLSTDGGTSDGRFIAPHGIEVVELGPCNATIHQVNERVPVAQLDALAQAYEEIARCLLTGTAS